MGAPVAIGGLYTLLLRLACPTYFENGTYHGHCRSDKAFGSPPAENEAPTPPQCPDQWGAVFSIVQITLNKFQEATFRFPASICVCDEWSQWRRQWARVSAGQSEKGSSEAGGRSATQSKWEGWTRWGEKSCQEDDGTVWYLRQPCVSMEVY